MTTTIERLDTELTLSTQQWRQGWTQAAEAAQQGGRAIAAVEESTKTWEQSMAELTATMNKLSTTTATDMQSVRGQVEQAVAAFEDMGAKAQQKTLPSIMALTKATGDYDLQLQAIASAESKASAGTTYAAKVLADKIQITERAANETRKEIAAAQAASDALYKQAEAEERLSQATLTSANRAAVASTKKLTKNVMGVERGVQGIGVGMEAAMLLQSLDGAHMSTAGKEALATITKITMMEGGVRRLTTSLQGMTSGMVDATGNITKMGAGLTSAVGVVGMAAGGLLAFMAVAELMKSSIAAQIDAEIKQIDTTKQLEASYKSLASTLSGTAQSAFSGYENQIKSLKDAEKALTDSYKEQANSTGLLGTGIGGMGERIQLQMQLQGQLQGQKTAVDALTASMAVAAPFLLAHGAAIEKAGQSYQAGTLAARDYAAQLQQETKATQQQIQIAGGMISVYSALGQSSQAAMAMAASQTGTVEERMLALTKVQNILQAQWKETGGSQLLAQQLAFIAEQMDALNPKIDMHTTLIMRDQEASARAAQQAATYNGLLSKLTATTINGALSAENLSTAQSELAAISKAVASGTITEANAISILAQRYGIATDAARGLIDAQLLAARQDDIFQRQLKGEALGSASSLAGRAGGDTTGATGNAAVGAANKAHAAYADSVAKASAKAGAAWEKQADQIDTARVALMSLSDQLAYYEDQLASGKLSQIERLQDLKKVQDLEKQITDEKEKQYKSALDLQKLTTENALKRLDEKKQLEQANAILRSSTATGEMRERARLQIQLISADQLERQYAIGKTRGEAGGGMPMIPGMPSMPTMPGVRGGAIPVPGITGGTAGAGGGALHLTINLSAQQLVDALYPIMGPEIVADLLAGGARMNSAKGGRT